MIIDHHTSTLNQKIKFESLVNIHGSGSMLSLYYLSEKLGYDIPKGLKALVKYTNDFDMFFLRHPESLILNNIFWKLGLFKFIEEYSNGLNNDNWVGSKLYQMGLDQQKVIEDYVKNCDKYEVEDVMVVAADEFISNIPLILTEKENFIIIRKDLTVSFRTKNIDMNPFYLEIKEHGFNPGGHPNAGGCQVEQEKLLDLIELFVNFIKKVKHDAEKI